VWQAFGALEDAVRTGGSAFAHAHGTGLFAALAADPPLAGRFTAAMGSVTAAQTDPVVKGFDFGDDDCVRVLRACRAAVRPGGRVLVPALVLPEAGSGARTRGTRRWRWR
jgi:hypothetical protein